MLAFLENPRRAPRLLARCWAAVTSARGAFDAETEDVGAMGCRLSSPRVVSAGEPILLRLYAQGLSDGLRVPARIAWTSLVHPWRLGVAFDPDARRSTEAWIGRLLEATPGLPASPRVPARIAFRAGVWLGPPPRFVVDLSPEELELLRAIGAGTTVGDLHQRFHQQWTTLQPAFFSLLARRLATLQRGGSVHPIAWRALLREPARAASGAPPARRQTELPTAFAPLARSHARPAALAPPLRSDARLADFAPPMIQPDAWRADPAPPPASTDPFWIGRRSPEAEALYARALERLARNQSTVARTLLLQAARVAPGDPGIAAALVRAERKA